MSHTGTHVLPPSVERSALCRTFAPGALAPPSSRAHPARMPTYGEYLRTDELLGLQTPLSDGPEHDEMLFIVIHQVYELWFKQVLHELDYLEWLLSRNDGGRAPHTLKRILTILKVMVAQLDILETMTPLEFLSFRDRLEAGSGFQSHQFRELEFALGLKDRRALERYPEGSEPRRRLERRLQAGTLWDAFLHYLQANGVAVPRSDLERDVTRNVEPSPELRPALVEVYRHHPGLADLCERLVDLDEGLQEWRYRHVKMVQRTIGTKRGTGDSTGAEYLMSTLNKPLFPDLWAIRTEL
jgi:tryptophan 2,3-dioxygenase